MNFRSFSASNDSRSYSLVFRICALVGIICAGSQQVFAGALDELSPSEREAVEKAVAGHHKQFVKRVPVQGSLWPEFRVFQKVDATPMEVAAVFTDFNNHKNYFGKLGITKSEIVSGEGTRTQEVSYYLDVPLASDEYSCLDQIRSDASQESFEVEWDVIRSKRCYAKSPDRKTWSRGSIRFEPYQGGTLVAYASHIDPKEATGVTWGWVVNKAESTVTQTVAVLATQTESELNSSLLKDQVAALRTVLAR